VGINTLNIQSSMNWILAREVGLAAYVLRRLQWRSLSRDKNAVSDFVLPNGQKIKLPHQSFFAADIYCTDGYVDWGSEQLLMGYLGQQQPGVCYDVGANMGYYSLLLGGSALEVVGFEPDPRNHTALLDQGIPNLTLVAEAVSDQVGNASFDVSEASTVGHLLLDEAKPNSITVKTTTLDHFRSQQPKTAKVSAVKMDVEGYEILALKGASELTTNDQPLYLVEYALDAGAPNTFQALGEFLTTHHYQLYAMVRDEAPLWSYHTTLRNLQATELEGLDFKMLFLVPPGDAYFNKQVEKGFCFESLRKNRSTLPS
jgi:FkbM family methyltransferase